MYLRWCVDWQRVNRHVRAAVFSGARAAAAEAAAAGPPSLAAAVAAGASVLGARGPPLLGSSGSAPSLGALGALPRSPASRSGGGSGGVGRVVVPPLSLSLTGSIDVGDAQLLSDGLLLSDGQREQGASTGTPARSGLAHPASTDRDRQAGEAGGDGGGGSGGGGGTPLASSGPLSAVASPGPASAAGRRGGPGPGSHQGTPPPAVASPPAVDAVRRDFLTAGGGGRGAPTTGGGGRGTPTAGGGGSTGTLPSISPLARARAQGEAGAGSPKGPARGGAPRKRGPAASPGGYGDRGSDLLQTH
jgi:hypothetical protein